MPTATITPAADEYAQPYQGYVSRVPPGNIVQQLEQQGAATAALLARVAPEQAQYRYAPGKWSVIEIVGHLSDTERIFAYRALRIARGDETPLPGFDENRYVPAAEFGRRPLADVAHELATVRAATVALFQSLADADWPRRGVASGYPVSVRALGHIIVGHQLHHLEVLRTRYGVGGAAG